jgi:TonB family protein
MHTVSRFSGSRQFQLYTHTLILLSLLSFAVPARSDQHEMETSLRNHFEKRILVLRNFYSDSTLHFDKEGNLLGDAKLGYCSSDSTIYVDGMKIDKQHVLTIKGKRVLNLFDEKSGHLNNVLTKVPIQIVVELDSTWQDASQVELLLDKIVTTDIRQTADAIPKYWQCWIYGSVEQSEKGIWKCSSDNVPHVESIGLSASSGAMAKYSVRNGKRVFYVGGSVLPPVKMFSPAPKYVPLAKEKRIQGTTVLDLIINEQGEVSVIGIAKPLGAGLDDEAIRTIRTWRFKPATRNLEPVAVFVHMETKFALY